MMTIKQIFFFTLLVGCISSCTKDTSEGPDLDLLYGDFSLTTPFNLDNETPDFSAGEVVGFQAEFTTIVDWKITITGEASGSIKEITGFSNHINPDTVIWNGNTTYIPFFQSELCIAELSFPDFPDSLFIDSLIIDSPRTYGEDGVIIADFESGELPKGAIMTKESGSNMTFRISNQMDVAQDAPLEGDYYYKLGGTVNWNWSLGYIDIPILLDASTTSDPSNFYINIGVLSDTEDLNTDQFLNVLISESDNPFNDPPEGGADIFGTNVEVYKTQIRPVDWDGWRFFAIPYDEFDIKNPNAPGVVNDPNPQDIKGIRIACQACPSLNESESCPENENTIVRTDIDFVIFTENEPLVN